MVEAAVRVMPRPAVAICPANTRTAGVVLKGVDLGGTVGARRRGSRQ